MIDFYEGIKPVVLVVLIMFFLSRFATRERNALLLYNGRFNEKHDFIAVEIIEEQIQLTFSAGTTVTSLHYLSSPDEESELWPKHQNVVVLPVYFGSLKSHDRQTLLSKVT